MRSVMRFHAMSRGDSRPPTCLSQVSCPAGSASRCRGASFPRLCGDSAPAVDLASSWSCRYPAVCRLLAPVGQEVLDLGARAAVVLRSLQRCNVGRSVLPRTFRLRDLEAELLKSYQDVLDSDVSGPAAPVLH